MPKQKPTFSELSALGYAVVPIVPAGCSFTDSKGKSKPGGKTPGTYRKGVWRGIAGWQHYLDSRADESTLAKWDGYPSPNVGILTGDTIAIDCDLPDQRTAEEVYRIAGEIFGSNDYLRFGRRPKFILVYRTTQRFRKIISNKYEIDGETQQIEILGEGQQFVAYGTHPGTGKPYEWPSEDIARIQSTLLPVVSTEQLYVFIGAFHALLDRHPNATLIGRDKSTDNNEHKTAESLLDKNNQLHRAVDSIHNDMHYDEWIRTGMAIKAATDDEAEAFELFDAFSQKHPNYDAALTREKFDTLNPTSIGAGTIYYLAEQYGFDAKPDPTKEFSPVDLTQLAPKPNDLQATWLQPIDVSKLPPRQWVLGHYLLKGQVTTLVAPGGVGKSTLTLAWAASIATQQNLAAAVPHERGKVWVINNEDDENELYRRFAAVQQHYGIAWEDLSERLILSGRGDRKFRVATRNQSGKLDASRHVAQAVEFIRAYHISTIIIDPMVGTHEGNENDNAEMEIVMDCYRRIAREGGCSVCVVHHTSKPQGGSSEGFAGNANASRGASAVINAARVSLTLFDMSIADSERFGVPDTQRNRYARLDDAKANLSLRSGVMNWFYRETVKLSNGDEVGVLRPVELADRSIQRADAIVEEVAKFVLGEHKDEVSVMDAARHLMTQALWMDQTVSTLRRHIAKSFEIGVVHDGIMISYARRDDKKIKEILIKQEA